jgi:hypothetical protein
MHGQCNRKIEGIIGSLVDDNKLMPNYLISVSQQYTPLHLIFVILTF